jgi:hypothetical protein
MNLPAGDDDNFPREIGDIFIRIEGNGVREHFGRCGVGCRMNEGHKGENERRRWLVIARIDLLELCSNVSNNNGGGRLDILADMGQRRKLRRLHNVNCEPRKHLTHLPT